MPHRRPAPYQNPVNRTMARALPAPSIPWLDGVIFGIVVALIRLF